MGGAGQSETILQEENTEAFCIETIRFARMKGFSLTIPKFDEVIGILGQEDYRETYEELCAELAKECNFAVAYLNSVESRGGYAWMSLNNGEKWELRLVNFNDKA